MIQGAFTWVGAPNVGEVNLKDRVTRRFIARSREASKHEIGTLNCCIALKFDRHIDSNAAKVPVKFQSDWTILNTNLSASRLHKILR